MKTRAALHFLAATGLALAGAVHAQDAAIAPGAMSSQGAGQAPDATASTGAAADMARGKYLVQAADCVVCHTAEKGQPFAGGLSFKTPFGTMYSSNITPDKVAGIGNWTNQQFIDAVKHGIRADGAHLYPSMPYTSYVKLTDEDVTAMRTYLMSLAPVATKPPENVMGFPYNQRWSLAGWNLLNFSDKPFTPDPAKSAQLNRGEYVAVALGHCEECHTPRNALMGLSSQHYAGAMIDGWQAFNISSDPHAGIGSWSADDLKRYLTTGSLPGKASAGGAMADVISHSLRFMSDEDMDALVAYIRSQPAQGGKATASRFEHGQATDLVDQDVRGFTAGAEAGGAVLFSGNCAACHAVSGKGIGQDLYYPSLFHNSTTGADTPNNLIQVILHGIQRTNGKGDAIVMPGFAKALSDQEIATLANFVATNFGNPAMKITADQVAALRENNVTVIPGWLLVGGGALAVLILLAIVGFLVRRRRRHAHPQRIRS